MGFKRSIRHNQSTKDYDRIDYNSDGQKFYGYDDEEGHTDWYDEHNNLDSRTETPDDDEY